jgi:pheromone shutdown-related protein TraB
MEYKNLTLIGTSHISPESIKKVREIIREKKPNFVAIELDKGRFEGLMHPEKKRRIKLKDVKKIGVSGLLFAIFGKWIEEKLGKIVGTRPGDEMKGAVYEAAKVNAKVLLIDQEINVTLRRLFKTLTWKEKFTFFWDIVEGLLGKGEQIKFDLRSVPQEELIEKLILQVKGRYPSVHKVLIQERNVYMANKLKNFMIKNPEAVIVAVIGAGHKKGIEEILTKSFSSAFYA